ncbi:hypothetical protein Zmor_015220 [Zophobas morio]|uniref:Uncharacterized protein n=1 Tax=Zophobas morio TaxID=2755281 RepID=A0AA38MH20_9CUCU|nr:hypothetical protein Zmor_015220 [Zophobas morio]
MKCLRRWKKGKGIKEEYWQAKNNYRKLCREKKEEIQQEKEEKMKAIRTEQEASHYINKERKNKITISEDIPIIQWKKHFMELLNGKEERIVAQDSKTGSGGREREAEIRIEEVGKQVGRLKKEKHRGGMGW